MEKLEYSKEKWEAAGFLQEIPDERKDYVVERLNNTLDLLNNLSIQYFTNKHYFITRESDGMTLYAEDLVTIEGVFVPMIYRILNFVDISIDEIKNIYHQFKFDYIEKLRKGELVYNNRIDFEAEFIFEYSEKIIKSIQAKNNNN